MIKCQEFIKKNTALTDSYKATSSLFFMPPSHHTSSKLSICVAQPGAQLYTAPGAKIVIASIRHPRISPMEIMFALHL